MNKTLTVLLLLVLGAWAAAQFVDASVYCVYQPGDRVGVWHRLVGCWFNRGGARVTLVLANKEYGLGGGGWTGGFHGRVRAAQKVSPLSVPALDDAGAWHNVIIPYWLLALPLLWRMWRRRRARLRLGPGFPVANGGLT